MMADVRRIVPFDVNRRRITGRKDITHMASVEKENRGGGTGNWKTGVHRCSRSLRGNYSCSRYGLLQLRPAAPLPHPLFTSLCITREMHQSRLVIKFRLRLASNVDTWRLRVQLLGSTINSSAYLVGSSRNRCYSHGEDALV